MEWGRLFRQVLVAVAGGLSVLGVALGDNAVTQAEWIQAALAALAAAGVVVVPPPSGGSGRGTRKAE